MKPGKRFWLRYGSLVTCIGILLIVACEQTPNPVIPTVFKPPISVEEGISNLPCWQGLCPGQETTAQKVIYRLYEIGVEKVTFTHDIGVVDFYWYNRENGQEVKGSIQVYGVEGSKENIGVLRSIAINLLNKVTIGQFIAKYGEPNCVYSNQNGFALIFDKIGTRVGIVVLTMKEVILEDTMVISSIQLIEVKSDPECAVGYVDNGKRSKWNGFGIYE